MSTSLERQSRERLEGLLKDKTGQLTQFIIDDIIDLLNLLEARIFRLEVLQKGSDEY